MIRATKYSPNLLTFLEILCGPEKNSLRFQHYCPTFVSSFSAAKKYRAQNLTNEQQASYTASSLPASHGVV
jgi:hypothetical protein